MATTTPYDVQNTAAAAVYELDADLLKAQVLIESSGDPWALRYEPAFFERYVRQSLRQPWFSTYGSLAACSFGLLQILFVTAWEHGFDGRPEDLYVPATNLDAGGKVLRMLLDRFGGDPQKMLIAWNGGPGAVTSMYAPAVAYSERVFRMKERMN